jgi:hypothetical protein
MKINLCFIYIYMNLHTIRILVRCHGIVDTIIIQYWYFTSIICFRRHADNTLGKYLTFDREFTNAQTIFLDKILQTWPYYIGS